MKRYVLDIYGRQFRLWTVTVDAETDEQAFAEAHIRFRKTEAYGKAFVDLNDPNFFAVIESSIILRE